MIEDLKFLWEPLSPLVLIAALSAAIWGLVQLGRWLIRIVPEGLASAQARKQQTQHPYRLEIDRVEATLEQLRLQSVSEETRHDIEEGERLLQLLRARDQRGIINLRETSARTVYAEILGTVEAEDDIAYIRPRN